MAFGALLGAVVGPAIAGIFKKNAVPAAALDTSETLFQNAVDVDQISSLNTRRITEHRNTAFNAQVTQESEEAKESNTVQQLMVGVASADKSVIEKLIQLVSS